MTTSSALPGRLAGIAIAAGLATFALARTGVIDRVNARMFDRVMTWRNGVEHWRPPGDGLVVQVDIDDPSMLAFGGKRPGRGELATAVRAIATAGAAGQAYDFIFTGAESAADAELAAAAREAGHVYVGAAVLRTSVIEPYPELRAAVQGVGAINAAPDADGVFRRIPLVHRIGDRYYWSLGLTVACGYLGVSEDRVSIIDGRSIVLRGATPPGGAPRDISIPIDANGAMMLDFAGDWETGTHAQFARLWQGAQDPTAASMWETVLKGRIAVIADVSTGRADIGAAPIDPNYPLSGLHVTAIRNIVSGSFLHAAPVASPWALMAGTLLLLVAVALRRPRWLLPLAGIAGLALLAGAAWLFVQRGVLLNVITSLVGAGLFTIVAGAWRYIDESRARELTRRAFESYFPPAVVTRLLATETTVAGSRTRDVTVLFSDIAGFTARSSQMPPAAVQSFLNEYFSRMVEVVFRHGGTVDKFIGDGLMVFFNDPEDQTDHAERCVRCAIEMQQAVGAFSRKLVEAGDAPVQIRIGINTGTAIVGDLGSAGRLSYTAVGATVNLAQRLESAAPVGGILISAETASRLTPAIDRDPVADVQVKGFDDRIKVFTVRLAVVALLLLCAPMSFVFAQTPATRQAGLARADDLDEAADALMAKRQYAEALPLLTEALRLRERHLGPAHGDVAYSLNQIGFAHFAQEHLDEAEASFARSLKIRRTAADIPPSEVWQSLTNLAQVYMRGGRLREAEPLLAEAAALLDRKGGTLVQRAQSRNNFGGLLLERGDFPRARDELRRANALWARARDATPSDVAKGLNNLALATQALGDTADAETMFRRSLSIREQSGDSPDLARALQNLAQSVHEQGRLDEAEPLYVRAVDMFERLGSGDTPDAAKAINNLAVLYLLKKDPGRAGPLYERSLAIREKTLGKSHPDVATSLLSYAIYLYDRGRVPDALTTFARGADIIERNVALVLEIGSEAQKQQFLQLFTDANDVLLWLRSQGTSPEADRTALLALLRRQGRIQEVLATSTAALRSSGAPPAGLAELARVRADLARRVLLATGDAADRDATIQRLQARADALEGSLGRSAGAAAAAREISIEALQERIPRDAVLVELFRYRPFDTTATRIADRFGAPKYVAVALSRTGPPRWTELGEASTIDRGIAAFRMALLNPNRTDVADRATDLAPALAVPLQDLIGLSSHVFIAPDADLNLVPFQALVDRDGRFLVERYEFTYLTGGRDLLRPESSVDVTAPVVFASPAFGVPSTAGGAVSRSFSPLPGTRAEARAIVPLLPQARVLTGSAASETALKTSRSPRLLHIATHGFFLSQSARDVAAGTRGLTAGAPAPGARVPPLLRSGLAFAGANVRSARVKEDGILTASEAATLDLSGTELVFLSACESGLGVVNAGDSVYGLRRAFVIAGARSQVLTLWQITDGAATRDFVVRFYSELQTGAARAAALRTAQREALADPARKHPFYWASFVLSGNPGPMPTHARAFAPR